MDEGSERKDGELHGASGTEKLLRSAEARDSSSMANPNPNGGKPLVALVLQGGGAMGAYHVGCYQALEEAGYRPDWVAGISIGAFNAAVIAGTPPQTTLARLDELWFEISRFDLGLERLLSGDLLRLYRYGSALQAMLLGQPNFFQTRFPPPPFALPGTDAALSYADNTPMRATLERLASFDVINSGQTRLSLGVTHVTSGQLRFFDNHDRRLGPEHVMASGALPPGFPPMRIDDELYWDGGCVSNTPLDAITNNPPSGHVLVFMLDLWDASGPEPQTIEDVLWRQYQIQYASRTRQHIEGTAERLNACRALDLLARRLPAEQLAEPGVRAAIGLGIDTRARHRHQAGHHPRDLPSGPRPDLAE